MSDNDFLYSRYADVHFPTKPVSDGQLFSNLDPGRDKMLALFKAAINQELGGSTTTVVSTSAWGIARVGTSLANAMPVQDTMYLSPTPDLMREANLGMPLLCLYRTSAVHEEFSLSRELIRTTWGLDYILPPLAPEDRRKLAGVLPAVRMLLNLVIRKSGHPAYENGTLQFGKDYGNFSIVRVTSSNEGPIEFSDKEGGNYYYSVHLDMETTELDDALGRVEGVRSYFMSDGTRIDTPNVVYDQYTTFDGVDINAGIGGSEGTLPDAVQARTDTNPDPNYGNSQT